MEVLASPSLAPAAGLGARVRLRQRQQPAHVAAQCSRARAVRTQWQRELPARGLKSCALLAAPPRGRRETALRAVMKDDEDTGSDLAKSEARKSCSSAPLSCLGPKSVPITRMLAHACFLRPTAGGGAAGGCEGARCVDCRGGSIRGWAWTFRGAAGGAYIQAATQSSDACFVE